MKKVYYRIKTRSYAGIYRRKIKLKNNRLIYLADTKEFPIVEEALKELKRLIKVIPLKDFKIDFMYEIDLQTVYNYAKYTLCVRKGENNK